MSTPAAVPASAAASTKTSMSSSSSPITSTDFLDDSEDEFDAMTLKKSQGPTVWGPVGLFFGAVCLAGGIVIGARRSGRGLSQRIMEARVAAQATTVAGLIAAGYFLGSQSRPTRSRGVE